MSQDIVTILIVGVAVGVLALAVYFSFNLDQD